MLDKRFWSKVDVRDVGECWNWSANKNNKGYGLFRPGGTAPKKLAHRLSYEAVNGAIPDGMIIMHSCDNPACVNPGHLSASTQKVNMVDCVQKERMPTQALGTAESISLMKDYVAGMRRKDIASKYGVSAACVSDMVSGRSRAWLIGMHGAPSLKEMTGKKQTKPSAKITDEIARDIKMRLASGEMGKDIADSLGIHKATVSDIKRGLTWRDV